MTRLEKLERDARRARLRMRRMFEGHHMVGWRKSKRLWEARIRRIERYEEYHRYGVDCAYGRPSPESLLDEGRTFIGLYLTPEDFCMTRRDIERYSAGGVDIFTIWEESPEAPRDGYVRGVQHGRKAVALAKKVGMPKHRPIYFAVDFEVNGPEVGPYFVGINHAVHGTGYQIGGYGSYKCLRYLFDRRLIAWGFQTYAWSYDYEEDRRNWEPRAQVRQVLINLPENPLMIGGSWVDYDRSRTADFGQWHRD